MLQILLRKNIEKSAKIDDFGLPKPSPNPPKIHSKSRYPEKCLFFIDVCSIFLFFLSSISLKYAFYLGKTTIFKVFAKIAILQFACIFGPKNLPKTLPKRGPNPSKIDAKNVMFFNIDFFAFWPRFWSLLGLQVGAKLAILASKN